MSEPLHELAVERTFDAPRDAVWRAVTEHLSEWWCPRPWRSEVVALEWRAGGRFEITMHGPDGETHPGKGVVLDVVPGAHFVFTNMLDADWNPQAAKPLGVVGKFAFADAPEGKTRFRSSARQWSGDDMAMHAEMGFAEGWGACADQLEEVAKRLAENGNA